MHCQHSLNKLICLPQPQEMDNMEQGFSLAEVLVSLLLISTTSMVLLKQQWQSGQLFNQVHVYSTALSYVDNATERLQAGFTSVTAAAPFEIQYKPIPQTFLSSQRPHPEIVYLKISWINSLTAKHRTITRQLMVNNV